MDGLDELDIGILEVLVLRPRASWTVVGKVLDVSASTAARRWEAMRAAGYAWMSSYAGPAYDERTHALEVLVHCEPARRADIARALAEDRSIISLSTVTGDWAIVINASVMGGLVGVEAFLDGPLWGMEGIVARQVSEVTRVYGEGFDWKFGALSPAQMAALPQPSATVRELPIDPKVRHEIAKILWEDPRARASRIAERLHLSVATVGRLIDQMIRSSMIVVRTEVSAEIAGWPIGVYLYMDVPPHLIDATGKFISQLSTTRLIESVVHPRWNLISVHWLKEVGQLHDIEAAILAQFPGVRIRSRASRMREVKRVGWLLDAQGSPERRVETPLR